jgi:hypothetical protein
MGNFNEDRAARQVTVRNLADGRKYMASTGRQEIADDASTTLFVENPSSSDVDVYLVVDYQASADAEAEMSTNVSQDGSGSALDTINAKPEQGFTSAINARSGDSYTVNGTTLSYNIPGGSSSGAGAGGGSSQSAPSTFLLGQGVSLLFEVFNRSGGTAAMGASATWFEVNL